MPNRLFVTLLFSSFVVPAALLFAQDKSDKTKRPAERAVTLAYNLEAGQKRTITSRLSLDITVETEDISEAKSVQSLLQVKKDRFVENIVEVQGGAPSVSEVENLYSTIQQQAPGGAMGVTQATSMDGRFVDLVRQGNSFRKESGAAGDVDQHTLDGLGHWDDLRMLLPADPVKLGASWKVNETGLANLIIQEIVPSQATFHCSLSEIKTSEQGVRIAVIEVGISLAGRLPGELAAMAELSGYLHFDIDTGSPVRFHVEGSYNGTGKVVDEKTQEVAGDYSFTSRQFDFDLRFQFGDIRDEEKEEGQGGTATSGK